MVSMGVAIGNRNSMCEKEYTETMHSNLYACSQLLDKFSVRTDRITIKLSFGGLLVRFRRRRRNGNGGKRVGWIFLVRP